MQTHPRETVEVSVDEDVCAASGVCKRVAPEIFDLPDSAYTSVVLQPTVQDHALIKLAEEAEEACPTRAILVRRS